MHTTHCSLFIEHPTGCVRILCLRVFSDTVLMRLQVVGLFFLHPMATKHTFKLLSCVEVSGQWRMLTDLEQACDFSDPTCVMEGAATFCNVCLLLLRSPVVCLIMIFLCDVDALKQVPHVAVVRHRVPRGLRHFTSTGCACSTGGEAPSFV